jgi:hypothetical protein
VRIRVDQREPAIRIPLAQRVALVEPNEAAVKSMCHAIEDPTFDATAVATNPRARCRPVHRPPRVPADRTPHCLWNVFIDRDAEPVQEIPLTARVRRSRLASSAFPAPPAERDGGRDDYGGSFVPDFQLEVLSRGALVTVCREFLVQDHLLVRALMMSVAEHAGDAAAREIGMQQWIGAGAVASSRLRTALGITQNDVAVIVKVLQLHPAFVPGYAACSFALDGPDRGLVRLDECDALREGDPYGWFALIDADPHPALDVMVQAVNPRARCRAVPPPTGARHAWEIVVDRAAEPAAEPPEAALVRSTGTARYTFTPGAIPA